MMSLLSTLDSSSGIQGPPMPASLPASASEAPRGQSSVCEAARNYKAPYDLELFFSSGCSTRDKGGSKGQCVTEKECRW